MNISKTILAGVLLTAVASFSSNIWSPTTTDYPGQVNNTTGAGGWWYSYSDVTDDGGSSTISWGNEEGEFGSKIEAAGMIDVDFTTGPGFDYPFAGIGFNWINEDDGGEGPHNISAKSGICVTYASTAKINLELKWNGTTYGWDTYVTALPSTSGSVQMVDKAWTAFKQEGWGDKQALNTALTETTGIQFKYGAAAGGSANLKILQVGWSGACTGGSLPTLAPVAGASVKASLSGRSLAFTGLGKASASVEVINLQGQVVLREAVGPAKSALNLSRLNNGVYIVRAAGKDVSFSHKITLQ